MRYMSAAVIPRVGRGETVSSHQSIKTMKGLVCRNKRSLKKQQGACYLAVMFYTNQSQRSIFQNCLTHSMASMLLNLSTVSNSK